MSDAKRRFFEFVELGKRSLSDGEQWCVYHPNGPLEETASNDLTYPVMIICEALNEEWDVLQEQGYWLGKTKIAAKDTVTK